IPSAAGPPAPAPRSAAECSARRSIRLPTTRVPARAVRRAGSRDVRTNRRAPRGAPARPAAALQRTSGFAAGIFASIFLTLKILSVQRAGEVMRSASRTLLSVQHWKARVVLWTAGAAVGAAAVAFAWLADAAQALFRRFHDAAHWWPWLIAPLGFAAI